MPSLQSRLCEGRVGEGRVGEVSIILASYPGPFSCAIRAYARIEHEKGPGYEASIILTRNKFLGGGGHKPKTYALSIILRGIMIIGMSNIGGGGGGGCPPPGRFLATST